LPKKEKHIWGFWYIKPYSLPWDLEKSRSDEVDPNGWSGLREYWKQEYPIQYRLREFVNDVGNKTGQLARFVRKTYRSLFKPYNKTIRNAIPRGEWHDVDYVLVETVFACIVQFYQETKEFDFVDWDYNEGHQNFYAKLKEYNDFIINEIPAMRKKYELEDEEALMKKEDEIMMWAVKNRGYMWT